MKITIVYGTERKGVTYNIAQEVIRNIENSETSEIFLPRDLPEFCISCFRCFDGEQGTCAHSQYTAPIREKLLWADLIILTSPVYSYHVSGQMKVFLDHFANMWIVHRPQKEMFHKQGLVIATASGPVYSKTLKEMKDSLDFWGVAKTYKLGFAIMNVEWSKVSPKIKAKISVKAEAAAREIIKNNGKVKPCFRVRKWFFVSRIMQRRFKLNPSDAIYWEEQGWTRKKRPWRK
ncbi:multimeric flavodoxin WrbA [Ruminiclostridium sufflavum DSM 19573]|uniref:Multimeric flavodoxin WrbA n=1 Tax=Ruminiclostridium sufflavum DSM 19573 TaxID=1121337 RepID=A0A318XIS6_9FIRM|nr:NAD(P)H-dependent oxidoreductase [Ruminiclostridium sufflavum]PYG85831.1 multimeric flavodoxin WrbA [Ruminiclostridium sufflavum DSM 19573]